MKVSIIIPVYNAEKYLKECLDSALNQTYGDTEIIAVDDGSTDGSLQILKNYSNKIKIISKQNGGAASALNAGILAASGEWVKWLNADDILYPNAIEQLLSETKDLDNKTKTILYANYDFIDSDGKIIGRKLEQNYNDLSDFDFNVILLDHHIGNQNTVLMNKSTIEKCGLFDGTYGQEDYELHLRYCLIHNCRLRLVQKTVAKYRIHKDQISRANLKKRGYTDKIRNNTLEKLNPLERERYVTALKQYRENKPVFQKIQQFIGNVLFSSLPTTLSNRLTIEYLRTTLSQNYEDNA